MSLPSSRDQTFGWQSIVPSVFLNAVQDAIVAVNAGLTLANDAIADLVGSVAGVVISNTALRDAHNATRTRTFPAYGKWILAADYEYVDGSPGGFLIDAANGFVKATGSYPSPGYPYYYIPVEVQHGDKISVLFRMLQDVSESGATEARLCHAQGGDALVEVTPVIGATLPGTGLQTLVLSFEHAVIPFHHYFIRVKQIGATVMTREFHSVTVSATVVTPI